MCKHIRFLTEFIFETLDEATSFRKKVIEIEQQKGYLTYGDVCSLIYGDTVKYNDYDIYKNHGWTALPMMLIGKDNGGEYIIRLPGIKRIIDYIEFIEKENKTK